MVFTRIGEGFGEFMAEYVLGQIISREHYLPQMAEYQRQKVWSRLSIQLSLFVWVFFWGVGGGILG